jgi:lysophospholipase L1-like esterase
MKTFIIAIVTSILLTGTSFGQTRIVAIGDSFIRGKGVPEGQAYPAQLEAALRARGHNVSVQNAGVNGDTTGGVLARLDSAIPQGTQIALVYVGANDVILWHRSPAEAAANRQEIERRLRARGIQVYLLPRMPDLRGRRDLHVESAPTPGTTEWHLNAAGYRIAVARTLRPIEAMLQRGERSGR